jgi:hypothetical protein
MLRSVAAVLVLGVLPSLGPPTIEGRIESGQPRAGELVAFVWHIRDPDPASDPVELRVDYGDGRAVVVRGFSACPPVRTVLGLDDTARTFHAYTKPGRYRVRATVIVRRRACIDPGVLVPDERASTELEVVVEP